VIACRLGTSGRDASSSILQVIRWCKHKGTTPQCLVLMCFVFLLSVNTMCVHVYVPIVKSHIEPDINSLSPFLYFECTV
jgi:hypothetical protein